MGYHEVARQDGDKGYGMTREQAFGLAEVAARSGVPMHPRLHAEMREALGDLTSAEEQILRGRRLAREADDGHARPLHRSGQAR